ncbi:Deoxyribonuclease-1-like 2 [Taenia solium]|eukprot:TsM_001021200 transcript=TsM_001021200 gene=TsM_001021200
MYRGLMGPRKGRSSSKEQIGFLYRPDKIQFAGAFPMKTESEAFERPPDCFALIIKENLIILGDMNADCKYLSEWDRNELRLRTDHRYKWLIEDGADTTVAKSDCVYDRLVLPSHIAANK